MGTVILIGEVGKMQSIAFVHNMKVTIISTLNAYIQQANRAEDHYSYLQLLSGMITDENTNDLQQQGVEGSSSQLQGACCQALHDLLLMQQELNHIPSNEC